ncbi:MAG TPA: hypothetical protein VGP72_02050 [Planctomycetota bacterium]|jgi:hypothetical protein
MEEYNVKPGADARMAEAVPRLPKLQPATADGNMQSAQIPGPSNVLGEERHAEAAKRIREELPVHKDNDPLDETIMKMSESCDIATKCELDKWGDLSAATHELAAIACDYAVTLSDSRGSPAHLEKLAESAKQFQLRQNAYENALHEAEDWRAKYQKVCAKVAESNGLIPGTGTQMAESFARLQEAQRAMAEATVQQPQSPEVLGVAGQKGGNRYAEEARDDSDQSCDYKQRIRDACADLVDKRKTMAELMGTQLRPPLDPRTMKQEHPARWEYEAQQIELPEEMCTELGIETLIASRLASLFAEVSAGDWMDAADRRRMAAYQLDEMVCDYTRKAVEQKNTPADDEKLASVPLNKSCNVDATRQNGCE